MKVALMDTGRAFLVQNALNPVKPKVNAFSVGAAAGFTPDPAALGVSPTSIYEGNSASILKTIVNDNELILSALFPNTLALDNIGNIMFKLNNTIPFLWFALAAPFVKKSIDNVKHFAGDLQFQSVVIKIPNIVQRLNLSDNPDHYASAKRFTSLDVLPRPVLAGASEVIIDNDTSIFNKNRPIFATRYNNEWWGVPGMKNLTDSSLGVLDGGVAGQGYGG